MKDDLGPANSGSPTAPPDPLREIMTDAIRYWEPRRIIYNLLLIAIVVAWIAWSWPHFRPALNFKSLLAIIVLAALANLCYCAAHVADLAMQYSHFRNLWARWRWGLWCGSTLFAALLANYWIADEIFPYVR
jgi:hypothetical protein